MAIASSDPEITPDALKPDVADSSHRRRVGEPLPAVLELKDLEGLLNKGPTRIYELYKAGELDFAVLRPQVGNRPRFSGKILQAWLDGDLDDRGIKARPHFGRKRTR